MTSPWSGEPVHHYCQECGETIRRATEEEARLMSYNPENFILTCQGCARERGWT